MNWTASVSGRYCAAPRRRPAVSGRQSAVQQSQVGGRLLGRRGVEIGRGQGVDLPANQGSSFRRPSARPHRRAALLEQFVDGRRGTVAGQVLHGAVIEIGDHFDFQPSHTPGPTAARSAAVSTYSICSTSGEPTSTANRTTNCSSPVSRRNARCVISRCLWTRNFSASALVRRAAQPLGRRRRRSAARLRYGPPSSPCPGRGSAAPGAAGAFASMRR